MLKFPVRRDAIDRSGVRVRERVGPVKRRAEDGGAGRWLKPLVIPASASPVRCGAISPVTLSQSDLIARCRPLAPQSRTCYCLSSLPASIRELVLVSKPEPPEVGEP